MTERGEARASAPRITGADGAAGATAATDRGTTLLEVRGLCKHFTLRRAQGWRRRPWVVRAVDDVSFTLARGETLGLVGESGSGKTTVARTILRAYAPTSGEVIFHGARGPVDLAALSARELKPLRREMQMVFQDPFGSLNPRMTVGRIVSEPLEIHGLGDRAERRERVAAMLARVGLKSHHSSRYPHTFSGGQRQRISIARALILHPALVVADEAVSALDVSVQAQVINLLQELQAELGLSYLFVTHDLAVVRHLCDRVAVMYAGRLVELATRDELFADPQHPYTRALLSAEPSDDPDVPLAAVAAGEVADPAHLPPGCAFHPRCPEAQEVCRTVRPALATQPSGRRVACHLRPGEIAGTEPPPGP